MRCDPADRRNGIGIHRAALFDALWQQVTRRGVPVLTGAEVRGAGADRLILADGRHPGPFDLIVDALGAGSPISPLRARPLPYGAVGATVDWPATTDLPRDELHQCYRAANRMLGVLPVGTLPGGGPDKAAIFWSLWIADHGAWAARGIRAWREEAVTLWPAFAPFAAQIGQAGQMTLAR